MQLMKISITYPNHAETIMWLDKIEIKGEKLARIVRELAMLVQAGIVEILHSELSEMATGATAASIGAWETEVGYSYVSYFVGSQSRGKILRWLDLGRGWVMPTTARALVIKQGRTSIPIFRAWARPSVPLYVMWRAAEQALQHLNEIIRKVTEEG